MATAAEHYATAEKYAEGVAGDYDLDSATIRVYLDLAQIHATLALASAEVSGAAADGPHDLRAAAPGLHFPGYNSDLLTASHSA